MGFYKVLAVGLLICVSAQQSLAGAWPRGKGNAFISSTASMTWPSGRDFDLPDVYGGGYFEYGLSDRLTLGVDLGSSDATRPDRLKAVGFLRYTLTNAQSRHQFALDLGGGQNLGQNAIRLGASYGTGLKILQRSGWLSIEAHVLGNPKNLQSSQSLDATLGVNLEHGKLMALFSAYSAPTGQSTLTLTPSYAHKLPGKRHLVIGVTFDLRGAPDPALKLGVWQEF